MSTATGLFATNDSPNDSSSALERRSFLTTVGAFGLTALTAGSPTRAGAESQPTKVLVLGGTGLVGSEVVKKLRELNIDVVATSRNGRDGTIAFDVLKEANVATTVQGLAKDCTAVISTIGAIGTKDDEAINGATGLAISGAKAAGVKNFVYIGNAPEVAEWAQDFDFLQKYLAGKAFSTETLKSIFGGEDGTAYTLIGPTFIYGGDKFEVNPPRVASFYGQLVEAVLSSGPLRAATNVAPEGFIKIALEPPVSAASVGAAAVAGALGKAPAVLDTYDKIVDAAKAV